MTEDNIEQFRAAAAQCRQVVLCDIDGAAEVLNVAVDDLLAIEIEIFSVPLEISEVSLAEKQLDLIEELIGLAEVAQPPTKAKAGPNPSALEVVAAALQPHPPSLRLKLLRKLKDMLVAGTNWDGLGDTVAKEVAHKDFTKTERSLQNCVDDCAQAIGAATTHMSLEFIAYVQDFLDLQSKKLEKARLFVDNEKIQNLIDANAKLKPMAAGAPEGNWYDSLSATATFLACQKTMQKNVEQVCSLESLLAQVDQVEKAPRVKSHGSPKSMNYT